GDFTRESFIREFRVDDILFERFVDYAIASNIKMNFYDFEDKLKLHLKAALAEQLFSDNLQAKIKATSDAMLLKVLELENPPVEQKEAEAIETIN
ncbi:MAG TPA: hypothetical protein VKN36_15570, partial [Eudoraea sp.]|nr:hypothetical protein [Eudoraea sp.]